MTVLSRSSPARPSRVTIPLCARGGQGKKALPSDPCLADAEQMHHPRRLTSRRPSGSAGGAPRRPAPPRPTPPPPPPPPPPAPAPPPPPPPTPPPGGAPPRRFEGRDHGARVSFFLSTHAPGEGPR